MVGEVQGYSAGSAGECGGDGEQPVSEAFGFPPAGFVVGEGEELHPGGQVDSERDDGAPDLVGGEAVQGEVGQAGVLADPDPVLAAGSAPVS